MTKNKKISVLYTDSARKDLKKLDLKQAQRIIKTIKRCTDYKNPISKSKRLTGIFEGLYRYRIGDYRAIFQYDEDGKIFIITILKIKHRKDIYK